MAKMPADIRSLCRAYTPETVRIVAAIVRAEGTPPGERLRGIAMLWERGWGKPPTTHTGPDGEGAISVIIRHIVEGRDAPLAVGQGEPPKLVIDNEIDAAPIGTGDQ